MSHRLSQEPLYLRLACLYSIWCIFNTDILQWNLKIPKVWKWYEQFWPVILVDISAEIVNHQFTTHEYTPVVKSIIA